MFKKKHVWLGHVDIVGPLVDLLIPDLNNIFLRKKEIGRSNKKLQKIKCIKHRIQVYIL